MVNLKLPQFRLRILLPELSMVSMGRSYLAQTLFSNFCFNSFAAILRNHFPLHHAFAFLVVINRDFVLYFIIDTSGVLNY